MQFTVEPDTAIAEPSLTRKRPEPTEQQANFYAELLTGNGHILLEARAGTGKSTSCREGMWEILEHTPRSAIRYCCFNKKIADEFREKSPASVDVGTMHAFGLLSLQRAYQPQIDRYKTYTVLDAIGAADIKRYTRKAISTVVSLAKNHGLRPESPDLALELDELIDRYDVETYRHRNVVIDFAVRALAKSVEMLSVVDFDDMLWLPVVHQLGFPSVDFLFIDECLPAWTPVHLADGSSKTIGEIVDGKLPVEVLSYDTETGVQKSCKVTKWSKTLNRKPLVKIKVRWARKKGSNRPTNFVVCTTDHKVWADGQWVPAGEVRTGMVMQVETAARKAQKGKTTDSGRSSLSAAMSEKNAKVKMGRSAMKNKPFPAARGGNGKAPTLAEETLLAGLGEGWVHNHVVRTGRREKGYPHCYKIDLANPEAMIAIEVDGHSHDSPSRRRQDQRKEAFLREKGWQFFRFKNRDAVQKTDECLGAILSGTCIGGDCPHDAIVVSVEAVSIPDSFVYDISVEDCRNFYANGILVHNCQDLNPVQHELAELMSGSGRTVVVGDPYQSIYAFRGADSNSIPKLQAKLNAEVLPLTVTFRCPRLHVELARELVPDFECAASAPDGVLVNGELDLINDCQPGDLVLCRANAPIIKACLAQIALRKPAIVRGRAIGDSILSVIRSVGEAPTIPTFMTALYRWRSGELNRLEAKEGTEDLFEQLEDKVGCLDALASACSSPAELPTLVQQLFSDDDAANRVTFSSVHRAKGSEARNVTYIQIPYSEKRDRVRPPRQWEIQQRRNLRYVATTRSLHSLTLVS